MIPGSHERRALTDVKTLRRQARKHIEGKSLEAERVAIDSYREIIQYLGDHDRTTGQMLKGILAVEEEHADELADLLEGLPGSR